MTDSNQVPAESTEASDATNEVTEGGSPHFEVGDLPPGAEEAAEPESAATGEDSGEEGTSEQDGEVAPPPPAEPFFKFRTADGSEKEFSSPDEAQQFFSSWNGRLSAAQRELNEVKNLNYEWQRAYESGELAELIRENQQEQGNQPSQQQLNNAADKAEEAGFTKTDWQVVQAYMNEGKADKALQYMQHKSAELVQKGLENLEQKFDSKIEQLTAPAQFQNDVADALTYVAQQGHAAVDDMGQPLFPEFQDGPNYDRDFVHHFRDIWLGQDYRLAASPDGSGFKAAYYEAKATYKPKHKEESQDNAPSGVEAGVLPPPGNSATQAVTDSIPRNPDGTFAKRNQALSMSSTGEPPSAGKPTGGQRSKSADILDAMRDVGISRNKHFAVVPD